jgi:hypothetical protein
VAALVDATDDTLVADDGTPPMPPPEAPPAVLVDGTDDADVSDAEAPPIPERRCNSGTVIWALRRRTPYRRGVARSSHSPS